MADERYEWLDKDSAERLLRGEPVEAADEHARVQAARLSGALNSARRTTFDDDGEMPGEAAAMAAFRKARADSAVPAGDLLGTVRLAHPPRPPRMLRFGRPVRFGIAAAVAGCALGGVAVAAGAGVLPFGGEEPLPGSSVSAAETPGPLKSPSPEDRQALPSPLPPEENPAPSTTPPPSPDASGEPGKASGSPTGEPTGGASASPSGSPEDKIRDRNREWYRKTLAACRDYRGGSMKPEHRLLLEKAAKGPDGVKNFCDRLIGAAKDGSRGDGGTDGGDGDGDNGAEDDGGESNGSEGGKPGRLPRAAWSPGAPGAPAPALTERAPQAHPTLQLNPS
ncbi:hypothetical protein AB0M39_24025 [Streptomyces sp. NPDC051907]|uniref:hypothetical protein n=1 Tax=Streptomyces sp. NPDC051907 TaxID=3155284 RepID=UPI0034235F55